MGADIELLAFVYTACSRQKGLFDIAQVKVGQGMTILFPLLLKMLDLQIVMLRNTFTSHRQLVFIQYTMMSVDFNVTICGKISETLNMKEARVGFKFKYSDPKNP